MNFFSPRAGLKSLIMDVLVSLLRRFIRQLKIIIMAPLVLKRFAKIGHGKIVYGKQDHDTVIK